MALVMQCVTVMCLDVHRTQIGPSIKVNATDHNCIIKRQLAISVSRSNLLVLERGVARRPRHFL